MCRGTECLNEGARVSVTALEAASLIIDAGIAGEPRRTSRT